MAGENRGVAKNDTWSNESFSLNYRSLQSIENYVDYTNSGNIVIGSRTNSLEFPISMGPPV